MKFCDLFNVCILSVSALTILTCSHSAKILGIFPTPYHSHSAVLQALTKELAKDGNSLILMTPEIRKNQIENVTEIDVGDVSYRILDGLLEEFFRNRKVIDVDCFTFWDMTIYLGRRLLVVQMGTPKMVELIRKESEEFDLIVVEGLFRMGLIVSARFKAPVITVNTLGGSVENFKTVGADTNFLFYPDLTARSTLNLHFWDRVLELFRNLRIQWLFSSTMYEDDIVIREIFGEVAPKMSEMLKKIDMLFLNANRLWDHNRPTALSVVYMGALQLKKPKPLPKDLKTYMDDSKNGVVYFSLGSKLKSSMLPQKVMEVIKNVFASLPYDVIWKCDEDDIPNKPQNVRLEKWLPQNDILYHPKLKVFVTHAGLQSTDEAIAANVPLIGLPSYGDQWQNAELYQKLGIGVKLEIDHLNEIEFKKAIIEVAEDQRYRENIRRLSQAIAEQNSRSGARAASFWVRHLTTHGGRHLRSPLADVTTTEFYMIDLFITALLVIFIAYFGLVFFIRRCIRVVKLCLNGFNVDKNIILKPRFMRPSKFELQGSIHPERQTNKRPH